VCCAAATAPAPEPITLPFSVATVRPGKNVSPSLTSGPERQLQQPARAHTRSSCTAAFDAIRLGHRSGAARLLHQPPTAGVCFTRVLANAANTLPVLLFLLHATPAIWCARSRRAGRARNGRCSPLRVRTILTAPSFGGPVAKCPPDARQDRAALHVPAATPLLPQPLPARRSRFLLPGSGMASMIPPPPRLGRPDARTAKRLRGSCCSPARDCLVARFHSPPFQGPARLAGVPARPSKPAADPLNVKVAETGNARHPLSSNHA